MRANSDDAAMLHDHNAVGALHLGQAVVNHQRGAVLHGAFECGGGPSQRSAAGTFGWFQPIGTLGLHFLEKLQIAAAHRQAFAAALQFDVGGLVLAPGDAAD